MNMNMLLSELLSGFHCFQPGPSFHNNPNAGFLWTFDFWWNCITGRLQKDAENQDRQYFFCNFWLVRHAWRFSILFLNISLLYFRIYYYTPMEIGMWQSEFQIHVKSCKICDQQTNVSAGGRQIQSMLWSPRRRIEKVSGWTSIGWHSRIMDV